MYQDRNPFQKSVDQSTSQTKFKLKATNEPRQSKNSSETEIDRCDVEQTDSENVQEEEINELARNPLFTV